MEIDFIELSMKFTDDGLYTSVDVEPEIVMFLEKQSGVKAKKIARKIADLTRDFTDGIEDLINEFGGNKKDGI